MTSQGSPYGRLRRALHTGNSTIALAAAAELDFVSLPDALELVLLLVDEPGRFRRAALRWHARYCADLPDVGFEEAHAVLACLAGLAGRRPKAAAAALASLVPSARARAGERGAEQMGELSTRTAVVTPKDMPHDSSGRPTSAPGSAPAPSTTEGSPAPPPGAARSYGAGRPTSSFRARTPWPDLPPDRSPDCGESPSPF